MNNEIVLRLNALIGEFKILVNQELCSKAKREHLLDDLYGKISILRKSFGDGKSLFSDDIHYLGSKKERVRQFSFVSKDEKIKILLKFTIVQGVKGGKSHKIIAKYPGSEHFNALVPS